MRWSRITQQCSLGMGNARRIAGVYLEGRILPVGTIIPENFKGLADIENIYIPSNYLAPYEPDESDYPMLYMLWPQTKPKGYKAELQDTLEENAWYEIASPSKRSGHIGLSSVPYGLSALMDTEGVCKAGQMAIVGDIVPSQFFSGLSALHLEQFQRMGAVALRWLADYAPNQRAEYMKELAWPVIRRVYPSKDERIALYSQFPASNPETKVAVSTAPNEMKIAPFKRAKTRKEQ